MLPSPFLVLPLPLFLGYFFFPSSNFSFCFLTLLLCFMSRFSSPQSRPFLTVYHSLSLSFSLSLFLSVSRGHTLVFQFIFSFLIFFLSISLKGRAFFLSLFLLRFLLLFCKFFSLFLFSLTDLYLERSEQVEDSTLKSVYQSRFVLYLSQIDMNS